MGDVKFREWLLVLSVTKEDDSLVQEAEAVEFVDDITDLAGSFGFSLGGGILPQDENGRVLSEEEIEATKLLERVKHELEHTTDARDTCLVLAELVGANVRN